MSHTRAEQPTRSHQSNIINDGNLPMASLMAVDPDDKGRVFALGSPHEVTLVHVFLESENYLVVPRAEELYGNGHLSVFALDEESAPASRRAGALLLEKFEDLQLAQDVYTHDYTQN